MGSAPTYRRAELVTQQWCGCDQHTNTERTKAEEQNRGTEKKNENQKWMRWNWVSSHDV